VSETLVTLAVMTIDSATWYVTPPRAMENETGIAGNCAGPDAGAGEVPAATAAETSASGALN
jgi:hypothetical protein